MIQAHSYRDSDFAAWEEVIAGAANTNFLYSRTFLDYHGTRFKDVSIFLKDATGGVIAVFPAAVDPNDHHTVVSHAGATYGGLVYRGRRGADEVQELLASVCSHFREQGFTHLVYKTLPPHLQAIPLQADTYGLWRAGAKLIRRDLWNVVALNKERKLSKGRKWGIKKAVGCGVSVRSESGAEAYAQFHAILEECLRDRHGSTPVHTYAEMIDIQSRVGGAVELWLARDASGDCLAGTWIFLFSKNSTWHTQYIASTQKGRDYFAVDLLLESAIRAAEQVGIRSFSFGASTESAGLLLNEGLFNFKAGFGHGSTIQDFYEINLLGS